MDEIWERRGEVTIREGITPGHRVVRARSYIQNFFSDQLQVQSFALWPELPQREQEWSL